VRLGHKKGVRRFCQIDGWRRTADAPGRRVAKHEVWLKTLPDGTVLRAAISKGRGEYTRSLFAQILKHELRVGEHDFWRAVDKGVAPARPEQVGARSPEGTTLPLTLVARLLRSGYAESDLRGLTREQAESLLTDAGASAQPETPE
jgi:hypothetical protein